MFAFPRMLMTFLLALGALLGIAGCGSTSIGSYTLSASPSTLSIATGGTGQVSVTVAPIGNFNTPVSVAIHGLPAGVTANPSTLTLTPGAAQTVSVAVAGTAAASTTTLTMNGVAGANTQAATVTLAIAAAQTPQVPDFTLLVSPGSQTVTAGGPGAQLTLKSMGVNGFSGTVAVTASGLPVGVTVSPATLNLASTGVSQGISVAAGPGAAAGASTVTFTGTSGTLTHMATLALTVQLAATVTAPAPDVTTYHFDNTRQGLNARETALTPATVNAKSFGLLGVYPVDGKVDAQPLYVGGLTLQGGTANVVYVATEHDSVYALDAATGTQVWKTSVLGANETTSDPRGCGQVVPEIGITSTPVIDRAYGADGAIFAVGATKDAGGGYHHRLHALDLITGVELPGSPTEIAATYPGTGAEGQNGINTFDPAQHEERAGLLLLNGTIYTGWSSHCDIAPYEGWVLGYSEKTLKQTAVLDLTPNGSDGSVWMSGYGMAADAAGNIYLLDANGTLDTGFTAQGFPAQGDFGNAMLKLSTAGGTLAVSDFFEPYNTVQESAMDLDMGSGGAMLLPDFTDSTGVVRQLVAGGGKDNNFYIGDRNNLGKFNTKTADNSNLYQEIGDAFPNKLYAGAAYFNNAIYVAGVGDVLKAFSISNARLSQQPTSQTATSFPYPGSTPSISSNGTQGGIVWALESATSAPGVLRAYDATNLSDELYDSNQAANGRDAFGVGNKFVTPTIVNGRVFVGTTNGVAVFGLLGQPSQ